MKVAIIGLEGLDPSLTFDELHDEMPNLAQLVDQGMHGPIASTHPPEPVPAWSVFATGLNPGRLGLTGPRNRDWKHTRQGREGTYGEGGRASSLDLDAPTIWQLAGEAGREVALVGVPQTFPVEPVDGVLVAGSPAPSPDADVTHPPGLGDELAERLDEAFFADPSHAGDREEILAAARRALDARFDVAEHLVTDHPWELLFLVAPGPEAVQRAAWSTHDAEHPLHDPDDEEEDAVAALYRRVDERIGSFVDALPEDAAVLVVSDHGAQGARGALRLNAWLRREGYLVLAEEPGEPEAFDPSLVDWADTTAWATGGAAGRIHLNVEGREPEGIVDPTDYEDVRDELQAKLAAIATDQGTIEARALKPREIHEGPRTDEGPDLLCYVDDLAYRCDASLAHDTVLAPPERGQDEGAPTREGLFVFADPEARFSGSVDDMALVDGASTVLELLGVEIPDEMEGRVLQPDGALKPP